jgi:hypothetical protein
MLRLKLLSEATDLPKCASMEALAPLDSCFDRLPELKRWAMLKEYRDQKSGVKENRVATPEPVS